MTSIEITIPGRPVPWARAGTKAGRFYTPKKQREHRKHVAGQITSQVWGIKGYLQTIFCGPVLLQVLFVYSKTAPMTWFRLVEIDSLKNLSPVVLKADDEFHTGRPDLDNLVKQIMEAIEDSGVLEVEDGQIAEIYAAKVRRK